MRIFFNPVCLAVISTPYSRSSCDLRLPLSHVSCVVDILPGLTSPLPQKSKMRRSWSTFDLSNQPLAEWQPLSDSSKKKHSKYGKDNGIGRLPEIRVSSPRSVTFHSICTVVGSGSSERGKMTVDCMRLVLLRHDVKRCLVSIKICIAFLLTFATSNNTLNYACEYSLWYLCFLRLLYIVKFVFVIVYYRFNGFTCRICMFSLWICNAKTGSLSNRERNICSLYNTLIHRFVANTCIRPNGSCQIIEAESRSMVW